MVTEGGTLKWKWRAGGAHGKVVESFSEKVSKTIKDETITRNGEPNNKALLIEQDDGNRVLKLEQEVERA
jgi:hypothetical protein